MTLSELQKMFPKATTNSALTGEIPMSFVNLHLPEIKAVVALHGLRRIYRGPRVGIYSTMTKVSNAHSMLLYTK